MSEFAFGPESLHLNLSVSAWAADGLLAIFFFVVGLELKREFVAGDLRDPARAALPIAAARRRNDRACRDLHRDQPGRRAPREPRRLGGADRHRHRVRAWPSSRCCPRICRRALRTFLLTLAVVDDLLAITVIAVFFTDHLSLGPLALALIPIGLFALAVQRGVHHWWLLLPLAVAAWALVHASGVHATVAGVLLGFTVPVLGRHGKPTAELFEHTMRPVSAGFAVPVFAFFAAGVTVGGWSGLGASLLHPVTDGVIAGLVLGKPLGVFGDRVPVGQIHPCQPRRRPGLARRARRGAAGRHRVHSFVIDWGVGLRPRHATRPPTSRSVCSSGPSVAGVLAAVVLLSRNAAYRRIHAIETADADHDGVPDVYRTRQD